MKSKRYKKISNKSDLTKKKLQKRKQKTLKLNRNKSRKYRQGGDFIPTSASHRIGKSAMITIQPSKLDNSKFISNIRVSGYQNNIDETLSSMIKSLSNTNRLDRPIYSKKIAIDLPYRNK